MTPPRPFELYRHTALWDAVEAAVTEGQAEGSVRELGVSNFPGFAETEAYFATFIANNDESGETKTAAAFHDFGGAVDENNLFSQVIVLVESVL